MRVRLRGINRVTKRLADGTVKTYHFAWKSGPALRGAPGSPEFVASYNEAVVRRALPATGTLLSILQMLSGKRRFPRPRGANPGRLHRQDQAGRKEVCGFPADGSGRSSEPRRLPGVARPTRRHLPPAGRLYLDRTCSRAVLGAQSGP